MINFIRTTLMKYLPGLSFFWLICFAANAQTKNVEQSSKLDSGKMIHFVDMTDIYGKKIKAIDLAGKIVVMNFWFIECPPCRYEIPQLSKIADNYKNNKNVIFIALSRDSDKALRDFFKGNIFNYRQMGDAAKLVADYGASTYGLSLVINKEGVIIFNSDTEHYLAAVPARITAILKSKL